MWHILGSRLVPTEETHRATPFEVFFDLVLVFAFTRVILFMAQPPTPVLMAHGLVVLLLLWWSFTTYAFLANQVRADVGLVRSGMLVVMAAIFVAALVLPDAWHHGGQSMAAAMTTALAYIVVRAVFVALYLHISAGKPRHRHLLLMLTTLTLSSWIPLLLGAVLGGPAQTLLWAAAFLLDYLGSWAIGVYGGSAVALPSPSHMAERHGLVLIIALGLSLTSVGVGAGATVTRWPVLLAALLALTTVVCLWWLYFENTASPAGKALARMRDPDRARTAGDAYGRAHFLLIAGVIYLALGIGEVLARVAHSSRGHPGGTALDRTSTVALYGGMVLYLAGRILFVWLTLRQTPPAQIVTAVAVFALLPTAQHLPALVALGLLTAVITTLVGYERLTWQPTSAAR
jgi:low temperature requirement protein LtrA